MNTKVYLEPTDLAIINWVIDGEYFLQTKKGNFIWASPEFGGDNRIVPFAGVYTEFLVTRSVGYTRAKGVHLVGDYCPNAIMSNL